MGTQLQDQQNSGHLTAADFGGYLGFNDYLCVTKPEVVQRVHEAYLAAGADVVETNTFGSTPPKVAEWVTDAHNAAPPLPLNAGRQSRNRSAEGTADVSGPRWGPAILDATRAINLAAARLARQVADRHSTPDRPRFVAGSLGPSGFLPGSDDPALSAITFEELALAYQLQAIPLVEGGCDLLLVETSQDILEVRAAVAGIQDAFARLGRRIPVQVQVTLDVSGRMLLGTDIDAVIAILTALPIDVIGLNCSTGPEHMREPIRRLAERCPLPISVIPNAGLPLNVDGRAVYPLEPEPFAAQLAAFVREFGVSVVGGCCGTTPAHIRQLSRAVAGLAIQERHVVLEPQLASAIRAVSLRQVPGPLMVGERVNSQGSRKVKELLLGEDYEGILAIGRSQQEAGAHVLDVCVALTERSDEVAQMRQVVKKLALGLEAPLCLDSTEATVIQAALEVYPGRALINSINLENGRKRIEAVCPLAVRHGAALVALTIDEQGMAKTAERKVEVARRIYEICTGEYGLPPHALVFDPLMFTLATGEAEFVESAVATLEGIRAIQRELPGVWTLLGLSNVSFGLAPAARAVLNSVFLYHCVQAGLDLAIVNPAHITPYAEIPAEERELAEDLIFNRRSDALGRFIAAFEGRQAAAVQAQEDPTEGLSAAEKIHWQILHRKKEGIEALIDDERTRRTPVAILNEVLLPAMKDVGDKFGSGELILPFVLQSAEVMKKAVAHLEQFLDRAEGVSKGKLVLATVFGDVHDIGKNLVKTILSNNGYSVVDLGKQVPLNTILDAAIAEKADAIGLSALLVSTSKQMELCVQELDRRDLQIPVIIGGAAINPAFGRRILFPEPGRPYAPGLFYAADAFDGLALMDQLTDPERRPQLLERTVQAATRPAQAVPVPSEPRPSRRAAIAPAPVPEPPFWGTRVVEDVALAEVASHLDQKTLFRLQWGGRNKKGEEWERLLVDEFLPRFHRYTADLADIVVPKAVYGYFHCRAEGDELAILDDGRELARLSFPRQRDQEGLCLADYFGQEDVVALQAVTVGDGAARRCAELQAADQYTEAYFLHGYAVEAAEGLAEWLHRRIRRELGLTGEQGKRYSWGYPAIPDLAGHALVQELLPLEAVGLSLTEAYQFVPEASTAALIVHHPAAKYFAVTEAVPV
ncbi:MAG: homocysteine S-methyltransferase family protein [Cyanobacteria bacterium REEB65]|nr:homocysteine S-methyltransferase family protein [Cyanobacteria bacterium REEB65]